MKRFWGILFALVLVFSLVGLMTSASVVQAQTTFTVNTTDDIDDGTCDATHCSLREAINAANATPGTDTIAFNIAGLGPHTTQPASALPTITDPVVIDGYTQPGAIPNTNGPGLGINAVLMIELDGSMAGAGANGLHITCGNSAVRGLVINRFGGGVLGGPGGNGIRVVTNGGNVIEGNFIGTDVTGIVALGNSHMGVLILFSANNTVGGTTAEARNLISANNASGVHMEGIFGGAVGNLVQGNLIGTDVTGTSDLGNSSTGVTVSYDASDNTIGGTTAWACNVISGNDGNGIVLISGATENLIQGNFIGTDVTSTAALGNSGDGVHINGASDNIIGGMAAGAGNVISGNINQGVAIVRSSATGNLLEGNYIGTDVTGTVALGNGDQGVFIENASNNTIGGMTEEARNIISGNNSNGIGIARATGNVVIGNFIGTDVTGTVALSNGDQGVLIEFSASNNTVGGTTDGARNVISGNGGNGVLIDGFDWTTNGQAIDNVVIGNFIGTDVTGTVAVSNSGHGVFINDTADNTIGGMTVGAGNIISGNDGNGVVIIGSEATGNLVQGNFIGTDVSGTTGLGNFYNGILIGDGAFGNTVGGTTPEARNIISGNGIAGPYMGSGIFIRDTNGNLVRGNFIGTDVTGTVAVPNTNFGVEIGDAINNIVGGTTIGARNVISGNGGDGIGIGGIFSSSNQVLGNYVGTDVTGAYALPNALCGIVLHSGNSNIIQGNVISGNNDRGVILGGGTVDNELLSNLIGTQSDGTSPLGNTSHGVHITELAGNNTIGGMASGSGNTIAFNGGEGALVESGNSNDILSNSIFYNAGLGIDLKPDGVTPNDPGDGDTGANNLQNFPILALATSGTTVIEGTFNSTPNTNFRLEFFANSACDPSGYGEGETFLGSTDVTTDGSGNANFTVTFAVTVPVGYSITTTATDPDGNTSEFSQCVEVTTVAVEATVDFDPDTLNLKSKGKVVTVYIELPEGYDVEEIDISTVMLNGIVPALDKPTQVGDYDRDGISDLMVKFDRAAVQSKLEPGDEVEVTISGELTDGTLFEDTDRIRVINKGKI